MSFSWNEIFDVFFESLFFEARLVFEDEERLREFETLDKNRLQEAEEVFYGLEKDVMQKNVMTVDAFEYLKKAIFNRVDEIMAEDGVSDKYYRAKSDLIYEEDMARQLGESFWTDAENILKDAEEIIAFWGDKDSFQRVDEANMSFAGINYALSGADMGYEYRESDRKGAWEDNWQDDWEKAWREKAINIEEAEHWAESFWRYEQDSVLKDETGGEGYLSGSMRRVDKAFLNKILEPESRGSENVQNIKFEINGEKSTTEDIDMDKISDMLTDKLCEMMSRGADGIYF